VVNLWKFNPMISNNQHQQLPGPQQKSVREELPEGPFPGISRPAEVEDSRNGGQGE
jgi:hypothetical protein